MKKKKRYYDIDLARDIAILTLPIVHIIEFLGNEYGYADILKNTSINVISPITHFFTIFVAPVFMICMGINMAFTKKNTPKDFVYRGIFLIILEFLLNLLRYAIPGFIAIKLTSDIALQKNILDIMIFAQFNSDILMFAGLCFLVFALFKKLKMSDKSILITTIGLSLISEIIVLFISPGILNSVSPFLSNIIGNFIYLNGDSTFPLIQWLVLPSIGLYFGNKLINANDENKLWNKVGLSSFIIISIYLLILIILKKDIMVNINAPLNDSNMNIFITLFEISASFLHLYIINRIFKIFNLSNNEKVKDKVSALSKNITYYYCIQWIIIGAIMMITCGLGIWGSKNINLINTVLLTLGVMIISSSGASLIRKIKDKYKTNTNILLFIMIVLIVIISFTIILLLK